MTAQAVLKVTGMGCQACAGRVEKALREVKGVSSVKVELKGGKALVEYNPEVVREQDLAQAVTKAGYGVET